MDRMDSTGYYDQNRDQLFRQYHGYDPAVVHRAWAPAHLCARKPGFACDIGAGTGRDANWLAGQGWRVTAVEPSLLRELGQERSHALVTWLEDSLPGLPRLCALGRRFDLILLRSVWMHVPPRCREQAFRVLSGLLAPSGLLVISLRHGSDEAENRSRGFHPVSAGELIDLAQGRAVTLRDQCDHADRSRSHIHWQWLLFEESGKGAGSPRIA